jgi:hypothetical protein
MFRIKAQINQAVLTTETGTPFWRAAGLHWEFTTSRKSLQNFQERITYNPVHFKQLPIDIRLSSA